MKTPLSLISLGLALTLAGCVSESRPLRGRIDPGTPESGCFTRQGVELYYEIQGQGQPLVLLSGGPGASPDYLENLRALAPDARLIFFHQRGTGRSAKARPTNYTIDASVEDLEQLRRRLKLESFMVFGHSYGGMLAQAYAVKYPARVSKLILADTFSAAVAINAVLRRLRQGVPEATRAIYEQYERAGLYRGRDRYPKPYEDAVQQAYDPVLLSVPPPDCLKAFWDGLAWDVYRAMWGEESEFNVTGTMAKFDVRPRLHRIPAPALVIVGAHDLPTLALARQTAQAIPNARLEVFEHSRHFPFIEEPERFLNVMRQFIRDGQ